MSQSRESSLKLCTSHLRHFIYLYLLFLMLRIKTIEMGGEKKSLPETESTCQAIEGHGFGQGELGRPGRLLSTAAAAAAGARVDQ